MVLLWSRLFLVVLSFVFLEKYKSDFMIFFRITKVRKINFWQWQVSVKVQGHNCPDRNDWATVWDIVTKFGVCWTANGAPKVLLATSITFDKIDDGV